MGSLERRLERLEGGAGYASRAISQRALAALSDEDLDALEDVLEAREGEARGGGDLYAGATERGRRALDAYAYALEDARREDRAAMDALLAKPEAGGLW